MIPQAHRIGTSALPLKGLALAAAAACVMGFASGVAAQDNDPLPSWNAGASKQAITDFVKDVSSPGGAKFVLPGERIAVFDNDGTLWSEQPIYFQLAFALERIKALAPQHPEWKDKEPFASLINGDLKGALAGGEPAVLQIVVATHSGMTTDEFDQAVRDWIATAKYPKTGRRYTEMVYQPMLELLALLRANGFKTFIVSGGGVDFMRVFAEAVYGVPPAQVIGSSGKVQFELREGQPVFVKLPELSSYDDKEGKPENIHLHIGRRPVLAFGNSDGDQAMLQYTDSGDGPRLMLLVHHDDAAREYAYDRDLSIGKLDTALTAAAAKDWTVVGMKDNWRRVFPFSD
jgi:phosphoglycolate phosphatase-like HAD superfamily hydrolase